MDNVSIDSLLEQMKVLSEQAGLDGLNKSKLKQPTDENGVNFSQALKDSLNTVNETQKKAAEMAKAFETGSSDVDLVSVMIQMQKAKISFEALTQVRNRLISTYHEIMNMQV